MRAVRCHAWGGPDLLRLEDVESQHPGPGEVRIAVHATAINFADTLMIAGKYQHQPDLPFSPGMEMAGEVVEIGQGVAHVTPGERVMAVDFTGGFAEEAVVPANATIPIPPDIDYQTAAAFPISYGTAHLALDHRTNLRPGETLLVLGAAGGVGLAAVQLGKLMGATVIAAAGSDEKLRAATANGADAGVNYRTEALRDRINELTDRRGVDVIFDPVGGELFGQALRVLAWEGRAVVIGFASGDIPEVAANRLLIKNISLVGLFWGAYLQRDPALVQRSFVTLMGWWSEGKIKPHVSETLPLEGTIKGLQAVMNRESTGRIVVTPQA